MAKQQVPQATEQEMALLGAILFDPQEVLPKIGDTITESDFYNPQYRIIAKAIFDMWNDNLPIDAQLVFSRIQKEGNDTTIGGIDTMMKLADALPEASHAGFYAADVKEASRKRQLLHKIDAIRVEILGGKGNSEECIEQLDKDIMGISMQISNADIADIPCILKDIMSKLDAGESVGEDETAGVHTGISRLNDYTGGFRKGHLIIIGARPSIGKSTVAINISREAAFRGVPVLYFSLEMTAEELVVWLLCAKARVSSDGMWKGYKDEAGIKKIMEAVNCIKDYPLYIVDSADLNLAKIKAIARRYKRKHDIGMIVVDYLQLMRLRDEQRRDLEIAEISRQLKLLAKELEVPVVALSQLNRELEKTSNSKRDESIMPRRPRLADLRESGALEQDANVVILLHREDYYKKLMAQESGGLYVPTNKIEMIIAKQRSGATGTIVVDFREEYLWCGNEANGDRYNDEEKSTVFYKE